MPLDGLSLRPESVPVAGIVAERAPSAVSVAASLDVPRIVA